EHVALAELRQAPLLVVVGCLVTALLVSEQEAAERDHRAGGCEFSLPSVRGVGLDPDGNGLAARVGHLGGDRALPDQVVEAELLAREPAGRLLRRAEPVAGRADRFVR